ncbi:MAG: TonB-dependent receptor [Halioglobus sp.]|nr:TonB-dependent receptor [Halioglobus sp.]
MNAYTAKVWHDFNTDLAGKLILNYRDFNTTNRQDEDGTADNTRYLDSDNQEDSDIFYSELQFNYANDKFDIVFGGNYSKENIKQTTTVTLLADSISREVTEEMNDILGLEPPMDHYWNPEEYSRALSRIGINVSPEEITESGDEYYNELSSLLGEPMIFGPSYMGDQWQESIINKGDFTNWGVYFDADYSVTERINIIAGLRYSSDKKEFSWLIPPTSFSELRPGVPNQVFILPSDLQSAATTPLQADESWSKTTGRMVAQYQISDQLMTYLSYSTGYKSGGFDSLEIDTAFTPIEPEESDMYELGLKGDLIPGRLRTQISLFQLNVDNKQRSVESKPPGQSAAIPKVINGDQTFDGIELTLNWLPTETVELGLVTTYRKQKAEWNPFYNSAGVLTHDKSDGDTANNVTLTADWMPEIPWGLLHVHVDYIYRENTRYESDSNYFPEYANLPGYFDDEKLLNGRIAWSRDEGDWEVALWGKNLTDEQYITDINNTSRSYFGTPYVQINTPRSYGIEVAYTY